MACAKNPNLEIIKYLIENKANVNSLDKNKSVPLHLVFRLNQNSSNIEIAKCLIENKANPFLMDKDGKTPIEYSKIKTKIVKNFI